MTGGVMAVFAPEIKEETDKAREEGIEEGRAEGKEEQIRKMIRRLTDMGWDTEMIAKVTEKSLDEVEKERFQYSLELRRSSGEAFGLIDNFSSEDTEHNNKNHL